MPEYECDLCDAPADYNFQDATIRYTIVDDDFSDEPPKVSEYSGQLQNDFYCSACANKVETGSFYAETFESQDVSYPHSKTVKDLRADGFAVLVYTPETAARMTEILRKYPPSWIDVESRADLMTWMEGTIEEALDVAEAGFGAETFESQYAGGFGSGSLSDVGLSSNQLTSTWGSGDFDSASLNSSGHQNVFARAEGETHSHTPHDYYTPVGPADTPDVSGYMSHDDRMDIDSFMAEVDIRQGRKLNPNSEQMAWIEAQNRKIEEAAKNPRKNARILDKYLEELSDYIQSMGAESVGFAAEYDGPSTLSAALSGARKTDKNGRHLTIIQRLVAKYGIEKGTRIYKHFGIKQKRASPKVRGKTRGTKSGPRRYSEGRVGGYGRSQVYQNGDRTCSWTKSGGHSTSYANSGKAWYQERGYGTPVMGPVPDTALAGKALGEKSRGKFVNPAGIVGYPFVPAQQREQKR